MASAPNEQQIQPQQPTVVPPTPIDPQQRDHFANVPLNQPHSGLPSQPFAGNTQTTNSRPTTPNSLQAAYGSRQAPSSNPRLPHQPEQLSQHPVQSNPSPGGSPQRTPSPGPPQYNAASSLPIRLSTGTEKKAKRKSWFGGGNKLSKQQEVVGPKAWVAGQEGQPPYSIDALVNGQPVKELWQPNGNILVYLFPQASGRGPSFQVHSSALASSASLTKLAFGDIQSAPAAVHADAAVAQAAKEGASAQKAQKKGRPASTIAAAPPFNPAEAQFGGHTEQNAPVHLYLPIKLSTDTANVQSGASEIVLTTKDLEVLVQVRNLFAFLMGQALVATERRPTVFHIFIAISGMLKENSFSNLDGSTYGEVANASFEAYVSELKLADVRSSAHKTVDMLILGERMRSVALFNEAYVHTVGKYEECMKGDNPNLDLLSSVTKARLEKSHMDLKTRRANVERKLTDFEFPGLFAGAWISKTMDESSGIRFNKWKDAFNWTKKWYTGYYKHKFGSWPPKQVNKHGQAKAGGLDRMVLKTMYHDLCDIYDALVDRTALTTRTQEAEDVDDNTPDPLVRALRQVLGEYDRSTPPVQPPIPFDIPIKPGKQARLEQEWSPKKTYRKEELHHLLIASYNADAIIQVPILEAFFAWDFECMKNRTVDEMADIRFGQWCFLYAVLQSLPMLTVDAPGIEWTQGVDYFLCQPPRQGVPWAREDPMANRNWYGVAGSDKVVYLPSDLIEHSVDGVYRRSHCWKRGEIWAARSETLSTAVEEMGRPPQNLSLPPNMSDLPSYVNAPSAQGSPTLASTSRRNSAILNSLEALPKEAVPPSMLPRIATESSSLYSVPSVPQSFDQAQPDRQRMDSVSSFVSTPGESPQIQPSYPVAEPSPQFRAVSSPGLVPVVVGGSPKLRPLSASYGVVGGQPPPFAPPADALEQAQGVPQQLPTPDLGESFQHQAFAPPGTPPYQQPAFAPAPGPNPPVQQGMPSPQLRHAPGSSPQLRSGSIPTVAGAEAAQPRAREGGPKERPVSVYDPNRTFDDIVGPQQKAKKKRFGF